MSKGFILICFILSQLGLLQAQSSVEAEIIKFQNELNDEYSNPEKSPLPKKDIRKFKGHEFFPIDLKYRIKAIITVTPHATFFNMQTSTPQPREHRIYGMATFAIDGINYELPLYQSKSLMQTEKYKDYLFLPFTDLTNSEQTYSAGRYIDLSVPKEGNAIVIDFNQSYNPYCAYSDKFSCPIVPRENDLTIAILAGVKYKRKK
jgi:uncharacterized protein